MLAAIKEKSDDAFYIFSEEGLCFAASAVSIPTPPAVLLLTKQRNKLRFSVPGWSATCPTFYALYNVAAEVPITSRDQALELLQNNACRIADLHMRSQCLLFEQATAKKLTIKKISDNTIASFIYRRWGGAS